MEVDPGDPAFAHPTKAIGPVYKASTAKLLAAERGWKIAPDGDGWRRIGRFTEATGGIAAIGALEDAAAMLEGRAGTRVATATAASASASASATVRPG